MPEMAPFAALRVTSGAMPGLRGQTGQLQVTVLLHSFPVQSFGLERPSVAEKLIWTPGTHGIVSDWFIVPVELALVVQ